MSIQTSLGTEKRFNVSRNTIAPAPGTYEQPSKIGEGPKCSIRPKTAMVKRPEVPGPGKYDPTLNAVTRRPPTAIAGTERRGKLFGKESQIPGPGAYLEKPTTKPGIAYSFKGLKRAEPKNATPGPGAYKLPSGIGNWPTYAMSKKSTDYQYI